MSTHSGGGGPNGNPTPLTEAHPQSPGQVTKAPAWAGLGAPGGTKPNSRNFSQIIQEEKTNRNILEIHLQKIILTDSDGNTSKGPNLNFDDLGVLLFDIIKVDPKDCLTFDFNTGRYDTRHIKMKPNIVTDTYVTSSPITFKDHLISVKKQLSNVTKVTMGLGGLAFSIKCT